MSRVLQRPPEVAAWIALDRLHSVMSRRIQGKMAEYEVTSPQYSVLRLLLEGGPQTANALSGAMGVTPGNLTGVIDRLEEAELIQRQRGEQDRRCVMLSLTPQGQGRAETLIPELRAQVRRMFAPLTPEGLASLRDGLEGILAELEAPEPGAGAS